MNHNNGEIHLATAARWYKRYLKRTESIAELKALAEVQQLASLMNNNNYRDVRVLANFLNSNNYLSTYQSL